MNRPPFLRAAVRACALAAVLMCLPVLASAQTALTTTTLSAALTRTGPAVTLASSTGVAVGGFLYVDGELMQVQSEVGTSTRWNVRRGLGDGASSAVAHVSGATAWILPVASSGQSFLVSDMVGACAATDFPYAPVINTRGDRFFDCSGGSWVNRRAARTDSTSTTSGTTQNTEYTLNSVTLPAAILNASGTRGFVCEAWGTGAANANAKNYKFYFGATAVSTLTGTTDSGKDYTAKLVVLRSGASTQTAYGSISSDIGAPDAMAVTVTLAETDTAAITVAFKSANTAAAAASATGKGMTCLPLN